MERPRQRRKVLTLEERVKVIKYAEQSGHGCRKIGKHFGVSKSQVNFIMKNKREHLEDWFSNPHSSKKKRATPYEQINEALWKWYQIAKECDMNITGPVLKEEAMKLAVYFSLNDFKASNSWLASWKSRHCIAKVPLESTRRVRCGSSRSDNTDKVVALAVWSENVREAIHGTLLRDIYSQQEFPCLWRALPDSVQAGLNQEFDGTACEERLTLSLMVNALGDKETAVVIGSERNPNCFKYFKDDSKPLGCSYYYNKKSSMTGEIWMDSLNTFNQRMKSQGRSIILVTNVSPLDPIAVDGALSNIKLLSLPGHTDDVLLPLPSGIVQNFKVKYKNKLLWHVVSRSFNGTSKPQVANSTDFVRAFQWIKESWSEVSDTLIRKCFKNFGISEDTTLGGSRDRARNNEDLIELQDLMSENWPDESLQDYLSAEERLHVNGGLKGIEQAETLYHTETTCQHLDENEEQQINSDSSSEAHLNSTIHLSKMEPMPVENCANLVDVKKERYSIEEEDHIYSNDSVSTSISSYQHALCAVDDLMYFAVAKDSDEVTMNAVSVLQKKFQRGVMSEKHSQITNV